MAVYQSVPIFLGKKVEFLKFLSFLNCECPKHLSKAKNQSEFNTFSWTKALKKRVYIMSYSGYVHTKPDKIENATFFIRIGLPSTLKRCFRCPKTELFENALQSG